MTGPVEPARVPAPASLQELLTQRGDIFATDLGNARRFTRRFGQVVRYAPEVRQWYLWSGTHWKPDHTGLVIELTNSVIDEIRAEALQADDEPGPGGASARERLLNHALRTEAQPARRRLIEAAATVPELVLQLEELDHVDHLLACPNGVVDLNTGGLGPADPAGYCTACCRVDYDPRATSPHLDNYLETFMPNPEDQEVLFGVLGTALRGGNAARLLPVLLGPSTSGKSQLVAALARLLGGYATTMSVSAFRGNLDDRPRPDLTRAVLTRLAYATEAAQSWELHADQVKRLTGGDHVALRDLYRGTVEIRPRFTPVIVANEMPRVKGADAAFRRRMLVVRFRRSLLPAEEDTRVREAFVQDEGCLRALLARLVEGARSPLFVHGVDWDAVPARFALDTLDAFDEVDHVGSFLDWMQEAGHLEKVEDVPGSHCVKAADLHAWYVFWVKRHGDRADRESALNLRGFGTALRTRGWESARVDGIRWLRWRLGAEVPWL